MSHHHAQITRREWNRTRRLLSAAMDMGEGEDTPLAQQDVVRQIVPVAYTFPGTLQVIPGTAAWTCPFTEARIARMLARVDTAPTGQPLILDANKNGSTIFTDQNNRLRIADGAKDGFTGTFDREKLHLGDFVTVDVDQIGSGNPGSVLVVVFALEVLEQ